MYVCNIYIYIYNICMYVIYICITEPSAGSAGGGGCVLSPTLISSYSTSNYFLGVRRVGGESVCVSCVCLFVHVDR